MCASANPKHMAIWVADMHFANSPRHVGWRPRDFDPPFNTSSMHHQPTRTSRQPFLRLRLNQDRKLPDSRFALVHPDRLGTEKPRIPRNRLHRTSVESPNPSHASNQAFRTIGNSAQDRKHSELELTLSQPFHRSFFRLLSSDHRSRDDTSLWTAVAARCLLLSNTYVSANAHKGRFRQFQSA